MKKILQVLLVVSVMTPLIAGAVVATPPLTPKSGLVTKSGVTTPIKNRVLSGELKLKRAQNQQRTQSGSTSSGRIIPRLDSFSGVVEKPKVKSRLETAAERQRQREADLENQHREQELQEDIQREKVAADDQKKAAEERTRQVELQKQQHSESIETYCARAERQGFLKSKWNVDTVQQCIDKLKALKRLGRRIVERAQENAANKRKALEDALKRRCLEALGGNSPVPAACRRLSNSGSSSGTGTTQTGGTLTTTR